MSKIKREGGERERETEKEEERETEQKRATQGWHDFLNFHGHFLAFP